ncbi:hypothetical protein QJS04_geneDACA002492 [Acorus gramineus]|uniref:Uncharacterized protein n=1 Tax=Acorus gramineus TaxID=55184 RepID=A0AAV9ARA1_ACOGR|nr:hypothetical protein QJS04_geneDACA002492 [Acorus gramineus]
MVKIKTTKSARWFSTRVKRHSDDLVKKMDKLANLILLSKNKTCFIAVLAYKATLLRKICGTIYH